ncbi:DMT family transporter, partial [Streptomyces caniscabiei]|uniref:DMT family transporter n=1 Tax=Streptomyces caniscabiei TaxID=2746961 RepID=UPI000B2ACAD2
TGWAGDARPAGAAGASGADPTALLAVAVLGVFGTGITFYLNYRLIADEGATSAATVGYLLPVVSIALGALFLDERVGTRVIAGMVVVLAGVALTRPRRAAAPARPARGEGADLTAGDEGADLTPRRTTPPPRPEPVG